MRKCQRSKKFAKVKVKSSGIGKWTTQLKKGVNVSEDETEHKKKVDMRKQIEEIKLEKESSRKMRNQ